MMSYYTPPLEVAKQSLESTLEKFGRGEATAAEVMHDIDWLIRERLDKFEDELRDRFELTRRGEY